MQTGNNIFKSSFSQCFTTGVLRRFYSLFGGNPKQQRKCSQSSIGQVKIHSKRRRTKKYDTLKPWKNAGLSKEEFERILLKIPSERIGEMYDEIHADKLVAAAFKLNPGDLG